MFLFGRLKSRDKEISIEIYKFLRRQHAMCDTVDYSEIWEKRIHSPFNYGYYLGFCINASTQCINPKDEKYRIKFIQSIFDELHGTCGSIVNKYISETAKIIYKLEEYLPGVEMFCCGIHAGRDDLINYVDRTGSVLQLKKYMLTGKYDNSDIDKKILFSNTKEYLFTFK